MTGLHAALAPHIFRAYDIRGLAPATFDESVGQRLALAFVQWLRQTGRSHRRSRKSYWHHLAWALRSHTRRPARRRSQRPRRRGRACREAAHRSSRIATSSALSVRRPVRHGRKSWTGWGSNSRPLKQNPAALPAELPTRRQFSGRPPARRAACRHLAGCGRPLYLHDDELSLVAPAGAPGDG